jgi:hypothetical protein
MGGAYWMPPMLQSWLIPRGIPNLELALERIAARIPAQALSAWPEPGPTTLAVQYSYLLVAQVGIIGTKA